ncbi:MAG: Rpn family recombination-promoting nuclease/putative transposase [Acidobacteriota bacterium]
MVEPRDHHDRHFRKLFSHASLVRDLLRAHLPGDWSERLAEADFTRFREISVTDDDHKRESDIVWRIAWTDPRGDPQTLYAFVLLEFQRTVERTMAVRLMIYLTLIYQDLLKSREIAAGAPLPAILPVVVYNGDRPWTAPTRLEALIQDVPEAFAPYRPTLQYLAIDLNRDRHDASDGNLFALLGALERSDDVEALRATVVRMARKLASGDEAALRRDLIGYIHRTARQKGVTLDVNSEENSMLGDRMKQWQDEWFEDGMQKGMQLGKAEGIQIGESRAEAKARADGLRMLRGLVAQQLEARFGALTPDVHARVDAADTDQLQRWAVRFVTASSIDAVFDDD